MKNDIKDNLRHFLLLLGSIITIGLIIIGIVILSWFLANDFIINNNILSGFGLFLIISIIITCLAWINLEE